VLAGGRQRQRREQAVYVGDRAAGNQGNRAVHGPGEAAEYVDHRRFDFNRVGRVREARERAVDVEKERPAGGKFRQGFGGSHGLDGGVIWHH
jgi:hypothetical protein